MTEQPGHEAQEQAWRYEIRGSLVWDTEEGKTLSVFEATDRLNEETRLHEVNTTRAGVWAAKAGLAQGKVDALEADLAEARRQLGAIAAGWPWLGELDGKTVEQAVADDMADYKALLENTTRAFDELSFGRITKPNTAYHHVVGENTEHWQAIVDEEVKEALDEALRREGGLRALLKQRLSTNYGAARAVRAALTANEPKEGASS